MECRWWSGIELIRCRFRVKPLVEFIYSSKEPYAMSASAETLLRQACSYQPMNARPWLKA